jgi:RNA polymerase sigma factor (sigma-70 family)
VGHDGDHGTPREKQKKGSKRLVNPEYEQRFAKFIEDISHDEWARLTRELIVYCARKHGKRAYRHGRTPDDYVQGAIAAALALRRIYDFNGDKTFKEWLMSSIDSDVSHQAARPIHRTIPLESHSGDDENQRMSGYDEGKLVSNDRPDRVIDDIDAERMRNALPEDLRRLHKLSQSTGLTAKQIADVLGTNERDIRNMERRLVRHLKRILKTEAISCEIT